VTRPPSAWWRHPPLPGAGCGGDGLGQALDRYGGEICWAAIAAAASSACWRINPALGAPWGRPGRSGAAMDARQTRFVQQPSPSMALSRLGLAVLGREPHAAPLLPASLLDRGLAAPPPPQPRFEPWSLVDARPAAHPGGPEPTASEPWPPVSRRDFGPQHGLRCPAPTAVPLPMAAGMDGLWPRQKTWCLGGGEDSS